MTDAKKPAGAGWVDCGGRLQRADAATVFAHLTADNKPGLWTTGRDAGVHKPLEPVPLDDDRICAVQALEPDGLATQRIGMGQTID